MSNENKTGWQHEISFRLDLRQKLLTRPPRREDARDFAELAFERAAIACTLPEFREHAGLALAEGASAGAASVCPMSTTLTWPDHFEREFPAPGNSTPVIWFRALGCALTVHDNAALEILCHPPHIAAAQGSERSWDSFWPFLCTAAAALVREPDTVASWADQAEALMSPEKIQKGNPAAIAAQYTPLLSVMRSIADKKPFISSLDAYRGYWDTLDQPWNPLRLTSLELLGLETLARDRGLTVDVSSFAAPLVSVCMRYQRRSIADSIDAVGFLDLEGFPRKERDHIVVEKNDSVIAQYRMGGAAGIPDALIDFVLNGNTDPPALDSAERVLWASWCAGRAGPLIQNGDRKSARALLSQAVEALDLVLSSEPEIVNERGRIYYEREPGRFRRERLEAYRNSLRKQRDELSQVPPQDPHKTSALISAEVIKNQLLPILEAMRTDLSLTQSLRPRREDFARVFEGAVVQRAHSYYERLWQFPEPPEPDPDQTEIIAHICPAGMLLSENELSHPFPGGYKAIAHLLQPHRVWATWRYVEPGAKVGVTYDGLVWCDDHWSWFPKPYRALAQ